MPALTRTRTIRGTALAVSAVLLASMLGIVVDAVAPTPAVAAQDPTVCQDSVGLVNGGFEEPTVPAGRYSLIAPADVPGWETTDSRIELWSSGFNGVPSAEGRQFAELNAYIAGRLYQDVATTPGQTLSWSLQHRGRQGTDVMRVLIGPPSAPVQNGPQLSDGLAWGTHTGTYVVPAGQTTTRFAFEAVSSTGGSTGVGNFLDNITFGTGPCLISDKTVENLSSGGTDAEVGDVLRYTVTTRNDGGNPARQSVSTDVLDPGLDFVPGSLQIVNGPGTGALTDDAGDDRGEYTSADRTVRVRLGDLATATAGGAISADVTTTYSFDARVNVDGADTTIANEAQVAFRDDVVAQDRVSTSQTTETPVGDAADLEIVKTLDTSPLVAGGPISYTLTVTNNGPHAVDDFEVHDPIPATVTGAQAQSMNGSCVVTGSVDCTGGALGAGDSAEITITGTLSPDAPNGSAIVNTAQVASTTTDPDPSNNASTASDTVTATADVAIEKTFAPETPVAGEQVVYTITATNAGPSTAQNVVITDPLDPETTFVSATVDAGTCIVDDSAVSCAIGTLAPGAIVTATVTVTLAPDAEAAVQNTATITTSTSDADATNNASSASFDPTIVADVAVTKEASASTVTAGDEFTYTIGVENIGPSIAQNAVLTDTVPEGMSVVSVTEPTGASCTFDSASMRCDWATLLDDETATVDVTVLVAADAPAGALINTASIASPADDADTTNNSASATVTVEQSADIGVEKTASPTTGVPGAAQSFTITVTNNGPSTARGVSIADFLPDALQDPASEDDCRLFTRVFSCGLGDLAPDASASVTITGTIAPDATGTLTNTATAASATPDPNDDNYSSTVDIPLAPSADVSVSKTTSTPTVALDGDVSYVITVRNDGPSTAVSVFVGDVVEDGIALVSADASVGTWSADGWAVGDLPPGAVETITVAAVATAEGTFTNTATASSDTPDPDSADLVSAVDVTVAASADLSVVKTASPDPVSVNGQITYTLTVQNAGPNAAVDMVISDPLPAELIDVTTTTPGCTIEGNEFRCVVASFPAGSGGQLQYTATVDPATPSEAVTNTVTVDSATADPNPANNTDSTTTPITGSGAIELTKTAAAATDTDGDGRIDAGDEVAFSFVVRNSGLTTVTELAIDDPLLGGTIDCPAFAELTLAPGEDASCGPIAYTLTQADIDRGGVTNTATATASSPRGDLSDLDSVNAIAPAANGVSLEKSAGQPTDVDGDGALGEGDTVEYSFTVTNTGTTTLSGIAVVDPLLGGVVECAQTPDGTLAPGATIDCGPVTYTLAQGDIDAGSIHNTATVTALSPAGTVTDTADADADIDGSDAIELHKTTGAVTDVDGDGRYGAGDEIEYFFEATNVGTTTVTLDTLTDEKLGGDIGCFADGPVSLAPGEAHACGPVDYALTQADIDAGVVDNTATVEGDGREPVQDDSSAQIMIAGMPEIVLAKTAGAPTDVDGDGMIGAGDEVDYSFRVTNAGTSTLTDAAISDPLLGGALECPDLADALAPGADVECGPVTYVLTQADVDAGTVHNDATVTAQSPSGGIGDEASADVAIVGTDAIELHKTAGAPTDADGDGRIGAGDTVAYSFTVTNTGTTTVTDAAIDDAMLGGALDCADLAGAALAPGDAIDCGPIVHTLTQADIDAGVVRNTATATAAAPGGPVTDDAEASVAITASNGISLGKTAGAPADVDGDGALGAGDTVAYTFVVTNTGTTTLSGIGLSDPLLGGTIDCAALDGAALVPGGSIECGPAVYTLTQEDVDGGVVSNTATVTAEAPTGDVEDTAVAETTIDATAAIELVKTAGALVDTTGDGQIGAGDDVSFAFAVANIGTTTVTDAEIDDPLLGGALDCPALVGASIAPGDAIDCGPYSYTLTQDDVDAQSVHNEARATAGESTDDASIDVVIGGSDGIALDKVGAAPVDATGDGRIGAGDEIAYTFTVRNTGTTMLRDLELDDPLLGGVVDCPALSGAELAPGDAIECGPVAYVLTQEDIDAQTVHNEATATGSGIGAVAASATEDVAVHGVDGITLVKSAAAIADANDNGVTDAGDTIDYTFAVTNTGTTTVSELSIADARVDGEIACEATSVAPGEMVVCGPVTIALSQEDIDAGEVVNTATASATGVGGATVVADASVTTAIEAQPAVSVEKTGGEYADANGDAKVSAGDTVQFRFTVTNTGSVTVTDTTIDDPKLGGIVACDVPDLAPGEAFTCGPIAYTITADEAKAHVVTNAATVTAISGAVTVTASDSVTVELPELAVTGGIVTGLGWAILLIALGLLGLLVARIRRTRLL